MNDDQLPQQPATELARLVRTKALSPVELMRATIARAETLNPQLNAICTPTYEAAMEQAHAAEQAVMRDQPLGILHGVPATIKDLSFTKGVRTMGGSNLYRERVPDFDHLHVERLRAAGGVSIGKTNSFGDKGVTYSLFSTSDFFNQLLGTARAATSIRNFAQIDAQRDDGLIKLLAEPNLMAISGQEASFNAGGKIFIPVARNNDVGGTTITLEEKEFGVGVKFKPTVLEGGRINLQVASRVSEPVQNGNPFATANGVVTILPSFNERRAETTVQLYDGQSFMIAGLIKSDSSQTVKRFPGLGELPIIGTLFRSTQFQKDKSELMFVITPRLVQPLPPNHTLPTDNFIEPTRREYFFEGKTEGSRPNQQSQTQPVQKPGAANAQPGGFDVK